MKIINWLNRFTCKFSSSDRTIAAIIIGIFVIVILITSMVLRNNVNLPNRTKDKNTYLYEEVKYADEIFINCVGINAVENDDGSFKMNLKVKVEQWNTDWYINKIEIKPEMFEIRLVDINSPSPMSVFMSSLARATITTAASIAIGGEINVIEQTLDFAADYITTSMENAQSNSTQKIKASTNDFEKFKPYLKNGTPTYVDLSFDITEEFLNSHKTMVLSIDTWYTWQQNIFLTLRPNTKNYSIEFDLNGGVSSSNITKIDIESRDIIDFPNIDPNKEGFKFAYWTLEKNKKETKLRDLYFYSCEENHTFKVYAYYEEIIPLNEYTSIGDTIEFKRSTYIISVQEVETVDNITIINKEGDEIVYPANSNSKYLAVQVIITKTKDGNPHTLDNLDDFYLKNTYKGKNLSKYNGHIQYFNTLKPVDDYSWIGLKLDIVDSHNIILYFEIPTHLSDINLFVLEVDFFGSASSKQILLK